MKMEKRALGAMSSKNLEMEAVKIKSEKKGARVVEVEKELEEERRLRSAAEERTKRLEEEIEKLVSLTYLLSTRGTPGNEQLKLDHSSSSAEISKRVSNRRVNPNSSRRSALPTSFLHISTNTSHSIICIQFDLNAQPYSNSSPFLLRNTINRSRLRPSQPPTFLASEPEATSTHYRRRHSFHRYDFFHEHIRGASNEEARRQETSPSPSSETIVSR